MEKWRKDLAENHIKWVQKISNQIYNHIPNEMVELDDLISYGTIGLYDAASKYDPKFKYNFSTYSYYRIKGEIFNGIRRSTNYKFMKQLNFKALEATNEYMSVNENSVAPALSKADAFTQLASKLKSVAVAYKVTLDTAMDQSKLVEDKSAKTPEDITNNKDTLGILKEFINNLPENQKFIINGYYYEDKLLADLAQEKGHNRSWATRLHYKAIENLKRLSYKYNLRE